MIDFEAHDFDSLATLYRTSYAGYKPNVFELADGKTRDAGKRYLHVALKYDPPNWAVRYLARAHFHACRVAEALGVPPAWMPAVENATLRVLEYPPGAGTAEHTDFNLFTIVCWRSHPADLELGRAATRDVMGHSSAARRAAEALAPGLHIGELGERCGLGPATPHRVPARPYTQKSIVYFASPAMGTPLPRPEYFPNTPERPAHWVTTTGAWQIERVARSRATYT